MNGKFERDTYPGRPKILFVGSPFSTHAHSWIDLLSETDFNVRLFSAGDGIPPKGWKVRTYITARDLPEGLDLSSRLCLFPTPEEYWRGGKRGTNALRQGRLVWKTLLRVLRSFYLERFRGEKKRAGLVGLVENLSALRKKATSPEAWLEQVVKQWKPDIIHTLGLDPASFFYFDARRKFHFEGIGKWVLQLRGGSDLTLSHRDPEAVAMIAPILRSCDQLISDNRMNFQYVFDIGVREEQISSISPVPGAGGLDVEGLRTRWKGPPSRRERIIVWPRSYECPWSKALPVLEALKLAWERIKPCTIYMLTVNRETKMWFLALPEEIRKNCLLHSGIPREDVLSLMARSRVMLAPSLVDGVPNSLYEAMGCGCFPILSPLETITPIVENGKNVLFARNLYPEEIADSLIRAMTDDRLVDDAATLNVELVTKLANRHEIERRVVDYYEELARRPRHS